MNTTEVNNQITCPQCGGTNVSIQVISEAHLKNAHHGFFWWLFIGWWWILLKWLIFTIPALIFKIFGIGKKKKIVNTTRKIVVCQQCGRTFDLQ